MTESINIRTIQHYLYCPRRFGLMQINRDWQENAFVVKSDIMHEHVHSGEHSFKNAKKIAVSAVSVFHDELGLYGIPDCIEFVKDKNGVFIPYVGEACSVNIVEYKPRKPKDADFHEPDAIQVFAQKLCADFIWGCDSVGVLYYADVRRRVVLPFDTEYRKYDALLRSLLKEMRRVLESGVIPQRQKGQKCGGCSMANICMPKNAKVCVKNELLAMLEEEP